MVAWNKEISTATRRLTPSMLQHSLTAVGTAGYMSPEQVRKSYEDFLTHWKIACTHLAMRSQRRGRASIRVRRGMQRAHLDGSSSLRSHQQCPNHLAVNLRRRESDLLRLRDEIALVLVVPSTPHVKMCRLIQTHCPIGSNSPVYATT